MKTGDLTIEYTKGFRRPAGFRWFLQGFLSVPGTLGSSLSASVEQLTVEMPIEVTPFEVRDLLAAGTPLRLVDVREPHEYAICRIEGAELIPMGSIPQHLQDLDRDDSRLVVLCHHGVRSLAVVQWLLRQGVENCQSMAGGIDRWSLEVDSAVPRY